MNSDSNGLLTFLCRKGLLGPSQCNDVLKRARRSGRPLLHQLIADGTVSATDIAGAVSQVFGLPMFDPLRCRPLRDPVSLLKPELMKRYQVLPLQVCRNRLVLAVADPGQSLAIKDIEFRSGRASDLIVAPHDLLQTAIDRVIERKPMASAELEALDIIPAGELENQTSDNPREALEIANDAPVVRAVNLILSDAVTAGASDIHIEPYEKQFRIRFRVDGILHEVASPPISTAGRLIARLKILAALDIAERRLPQDGRLRVLTSGRKSVDLRISTLPTLWGEKAVLRVLDQERTQMQLDSLGMFPEQQQLFRQALESSQGMILVTGPTGSGKSVTLYSALQHLNDTRRNIATAEDPVELHVNGVNQVQVKPAIGLTFPTVLRAFLRQDPDIIMVGEIRDRETAEIAVKAAQTGHLVLSTLHTNSAIEAVTRLLGMGVKPYNLVASLRLVIAQRLVRKLCKHCRRPQSLGPAELSLFGFTEAPAIPVYRATECDRCHGGYRGRIGIYEVVPITDPMTRIIIAGGNSMELAEQVRGAGVSSLRQSAIRRMTEGMTSPAEVIRTT